MVQESLSRSLKKTKKQIGGKYIRNFITDEPQRKPIFKTDLYLDTAITNQIRPLFVKTIQKPKPLPQILINKYLAEGKKVVNGFLVDPVEDKTGEKHQKNRRE